MSISRFAREELPARLWREGRRRGDSVFALVLIGFSILVILEANRLPPPFFDPLGSAAAPRSVAGLLILLAAILIVRWLMTPLANTAQAGTAVAETAPPPATPLSAVAVVVAPSLYLLAMQFGVLAFAPASSLLVVVLAGILGRWQPRVLLISVPLGLAAGYGLNALLTEFFFIDLPQRSFWSPV